MVKKFGYQEHTGTLFLIYSIMLKTFQHGILTILKFKSPSNIILTC
jgi:hypothetical protein